MVNENKSSVLAVAVGAVVGAGAVIAGAVAMNNKKNQQKVGELLAKAKGIVKDYGEEVEEQKEKGKETIKKVAVKALKEVKKI